MRPPERPPARPPGSSAAAAPASSRRPPIPPSRKPDGAGWWCALEEPLRPRVATCYRTRRRCEQNRAQPATTCSPRNTAACFAILNTTERLCFLDAARCEAAVKLLPEEMPLSRCEVGG